jgi:predicted nucleotidyltransferase
MHIDPKSTIAGLPALSVRAFLRRAADIHWTAQYFENALGTPHRRGLAALRELLALGCIARMSERTDGKIWYQRTLAGSTLALASAAPPLTRETADRKVAEFLDRVRLVNSGDYYLYRVTKVLVFGSYLSDEERINDVDLAVELIHRERDPQKRFELDRARTSEARARGRQFSNIVADMFWSHDEVLYFLKARARAISLHTTDDAILDQAHSKVIYELR